MRSEGEICRFLAQFSLPEQVSHFICVRIFSIPISLQESPLSLWRTGKIHSQKIALTAARFQRTHKNIIILRSRFSPSFACPSLTQPPLLLPLSPYLPNSSFLLRTSQARQFPIRHTKNCVTLFKGDAIGLYCI